MASTPRLRETVTAPLDELLVYLIHEPGRTYEEICLHFNRNKRTIQRWMNQLQSHIGAYVTTYRGTRAPARFAVVPDEGLRNPEGRAAVILHGLTHNEVFLMMLSLAHLRLPEGSTLRGDLDTLRAKLELLRAQPKPGKGSQRPPESWLIEAGLGQKIHQAAPGILANLVKALSEGAACAVEYRAAASDHAKAYTLDPAGIFEWHGGLYVLARKRDGDYFIPFALERFTALSVLPEPARIPPDFDAAACLRRSFNLVINDPANNVEVWFDAEQAPYARERIWGDQQTIESHPDGSCTVRFDTDGAREVLRWVLGFGRHARLVGPPALRDRARQEILAMAANQGD